MSALHPGVRRAAVAVLMALWPARPPRPPPGWRNCAWSARTRSCTPPRHRW